MNRPSYHTISMDELLTGDQLSIFEEIEDKKVLNRVKEMTDRELALAYLKDPNKSESYDAFKLRKRRESNV